MLPKRIYMGWKFQRTLEFGMYFSLEHFFISVALFHLHTSCHSTFEINEYENEDDRTSFSEYYRPTVEIKGFNVLINDNFFLMFR